jgi:peptidoglycan biosynthesis protein MviN/MurJ (putative lipid II flippase)
MVDLVDAARRAAPAGRLERSDRSMERTWKPTVAGILDLIAAGYGVIGGCVLLALASMFTARMTGTGGEGAEFGRFFTSGFFQVLGWAHIFCGLLAIPGGILNLQRRGWSWAVIFSVAAIVAAFVPGLVALILTAMSEKEFQAAARPAQT